MSNTLTFFYNANGGSGAAGSSASTYTPSSYPYTASKTVQGGSPTRLYYDFLGWSLSSGATSPSYYNGSNYSYTFNSNGQTGSVTFYAVWRHQYVTVTYNANGGSGAPTAYTGFKGYAMKISSTVPTRINHTFLGWSTDSTATTASYTAGQEGVYFYSNTTLYAVWKINASELTTPDGTLGQSQTISIARSESTYKDTITYQFGEISGTIVELTSNDTVSWTPPLSLASEITDAASGTCILYCTTYDADDNIIGVAATNIILSIPNSLRVTVGSVILTETVSGISAQFNAFVQSKSKVQVTVTPDASGSYGATAVSFSIEINGQTFSENGPTTDALINSGTNVYKVSVTDSRGFTDEYIGTYSVLPYAQPRISATAERDTTTPSTVIVDFEWTISPLNNLNTKTVAFRHRPKESQQYTSDGSVTLASYTGNSTYSITNTDRAVTNIIELKISDFFETIKFEVQVGAYGSRALHFSASDGTVSFHDYNPSDGDDHFYGKTVRFHNGVKIGATVLSESDLAALLALINS